MRNPENLIQQIVTDVILPSAGRNWNYDHTVEFESSEENTAQINFSPSSHVRNYLI